MQGWAKARIACSCFSKRADAAPTRTDAIHSPDVRDAWARRIINIAHAETAVQHRRQDMTERLPASLPRWRPRSLVGVACNVGEMMLEVVL